MLIPFTRTNGDMRVRVDETGKQHGATEIQDFVGLISEFSLCTNLDDSTVFYQKSITMTIPAPRAIDYSLPLYQRLRHTFSSQTDSR